MEKNFEMLSIKGGWDEILDACRSTVSKKFLNKEPSEKFKKGLLVAQHSPLRLKYFKWIWRGIPYWISVHFCRHHEGVEKFVSTQRNDRQQNYDRESAPQDAPVNLIMEANTQAVLNMANVRLCYAAAPKTRQKMVELKQEINEIDSCVAWAMVPSCIAKGGCVEEGLGTGCKFYEKFLDRHPEITARTSIQERYDIYNSEFFKQNILS